MADPERRGNFLTRVLGIHAYRMAVDEIRRGDANLMDSRVYKYFVVGFHFSAPSLVNTVYREYRDNKHGSR